MHPSIITNLHLASVFAPAQPSTEVVAGQLGLRGHDSELPRTTGDRRQAEGSRERHWEERRGTEGDGGGVCDYRLRTLPPVELPFYQEF